MPTSQEAWQMAAHNSAEYEFDRVRQEIGELVQPSMSAAEAGVRLHALHLRYPHLLADQDGGMSSQSEGGGKESDKRELLPLPSPKISLIRDAELAALFPGD